MFGSTGVGWLYSLADSSESNWGSVDEFYDCVDSFADNSAGEILIESEVWGVLKSMDRLPEIGDGLAFYHSTRAGFPENDPNQRRPRISLIGELRKIERDGRNITRLSVAVDPSIFALMKVYPIVRDEQTRHLFESCGIVKGHPATMYFADAQTWKEFVSIVR